MPCHASCLGHCSVLLLSQDRSPQLLHSFYTGLHAPTSAPATDGGASDGCRPAPCTAPSPAGTARCAALEAKACCAARAARRHGTAMQSASARAGRRTSPGASQHAPAQEQQAQQAPATQHTRPKMPPSSNSSRPAAARAPPRAPKPLAKGRTSACPWPRP
jgi:hypothetical protein